MAGFLKYLKYTPTAKHTAMMMQNITTAVDPEELAPADAEVLLVVVLGFNEGLDDGREDGFEDGLDVGKDVGLLVGYTVGLGVGFNDGFADGLLEGTKLYKLCRHYKRNIEMLGEYYLRWLSCRRSGIYLMHARTREKRDDTEKNRYPIHSFGK